MPFLKGINKKQGDTLQIYVLFSGAEKRTKRDIHPHQGLPLYGEDATEKSGKPQFFRVH